MQKVAERVGLGPTGRPIQARFCGLMTWPERHENPKVQVQNVALAVGRRKRVSTGKYSVKTNEGREIKSVQGKKNNKARIFRRLQ
jgi:hypothetical protein